MSEAYGSVVQRFLTDLHHQGWRGDEEKLKEVVTKALIPAVGQGGFKVLGTITLGVGPKTPLDFRRALEKAEWSASCRAMDIIYHPSFDTHPQVVDVEIGIISVAGLGFEFGTPRKKVYEKVKTLGWELCTPEAALQICLQLKDEIKKNEWFLVGMNPVLHHIFDIGCRDDGTYVVDGDHGHHERAWHENDIGIFMRYKK